VKPRDSSFLYTLKIYTDEHLKWDKPPEAVCLLIDLSVTLLLKTEPPQGTVAVYNLQGCKCSRVYNGMTEGRLNRDLRV